MDSNDPSVDPLRAPNGTEIDRNIGTTDWLTITQDDTNTFARVSRDMDPLHIDPKSAEAGPFGATIAFGFQTLSLLTYFSHQLTEWEREYEAGINYGFNKIRFIEMVPVGARIRAHFSLIDRGYRADGSVLDTMRVEVEIEGKSKPALIAEWLALGLAKKS